VPLLKLLKLTNNIKFRLIKLPPLTSKSTASYLFSKLVSKLCNDYHLIINSHGDVQPVPADIVYFHQFNVDYNFRGSNLMRKIAYMPLWRFRKNFLESLKDSNSLILANSRWTLSEARRFWALEIIKKILGDSKLDLLFIDGDHTYEGVKRDFEMYSPLVRKGGIITFHDIVPGPPENVGGVPTFWNEIKQNFTYKEIVKDWRQGGYGIGVIYV